ncbi:MAG: hypothetical protein NZ481_09675 [Candidatus Kapabacteria bacterium]|nr:hypothetical protein [Candidatus Kapabacteria bacterium]
MSGLAQVGIERLMKEGGILLRNRTPEDAHFHAAVQIFISTPNSLIGEFSIQAALSITTLMTILKHSTATAVGRVISVSRQEDGLRAGNG